MVFMRGSKNGCGIELHRILFLVIFLGVFTLWISACQSSGAVMVPTPSLPSAADTVTATKPINLQQTQTPTNLPTASSTPEPTPTSYLVQCPTTQATLPFDAKEEYVEELTLDEDCRFPCVMGFYPGDETSQILDSFSSVYHECYVGTPFPVELSEKEFSKITIPIYGIPYKSEEPLEFDPAYGSIRLHVYSLEDLARIIFLNITDADLSTSFKPVLTNWSRLDLHSVLMTYGEPDEVLFDISYYTGIWYDLYLYYEEFSTVYIVTGGASLASPMRICPTIERNWNGKITKFRVLSATEDYYPLIGTILEFPTFDDRTKSITELGYTIEEFTQVMLSSDPIDRCVYIPQSVWEE